ncbi:hypothetical protein NM688_g7049 [Phlebia brevispora]|uniref:Uncharacterized protein n=1 Tax=Phlebia brevispora TaxID=194682 RepID=A0ACC1S9P4_9APHY|nr:hypothetical protein NM688_g7049 [Phlebia brevispora]
MLSRPFTSSTFSQQISGLSLKHTQVLHAVPFYLARMPRYQHFTDLTPERYPEALRQGEGQAEISIERYHYLCAAIQQKYSMTTVPANQVPGAIFDRQGLIFDSYTPFKLEPVLGLKLYPDEDGRIHPDELRVYVQEYETSWKCMEGGIMYWVAECRPFWNMVLNYHSPNGTMGRQEWDDLFTRLKNNNFDKGIVPCMFFARASGCLDPSCPFLHDRNTAQQARQKVIEDRKKFLTLPTMRDISIRMRTEYVTGRPMGKSMLKPEDTIPCRVAKICSNQNCLKVLWKPELSGQREDEVEAMMLCSRCRTTNYCSEACQRADWKRHKKRTLPPL